MFTIKIEISGPSFRKRTVFLVYFEVKPTHILQMLEDRAKRTKFWPYGSQNGKLLNGLYFFLSKYSNSNTAVFRPLGHVFGRSEH